MATKSILMRQMTLAVVPAVATEQKNILYWAGQDTDQIADVLFTARAEDSEWRTSDFVERCLGQRWRSDPRGFLESVERMVVLAHGYTHCAVPTARAGELLRAIQGLASAWNIAIVEADVEDAWMS